MRDAQQKRSLFQILLTASETVDPDGLPSLQSNKASFVEHHPELRYELLLETAIQTFLAANFRIEVLAAYNNIIPYAYKADLARYCLLLHFGGLYVDLSMRLLAPVVMPAGRELVLFRDVPHAGHGMWTVSNGLMYAAAGREEFRLAIDMIVHNVENGVYGATWLHPTGPALLGRAAAIVNRESDIFVGEFRCLTNNNNPHGMGYVDGSGRLVAVRMKDVGADISHLGVAGTNNYAELWSARSIYRNHA